MSFYQQSPGPKLRSDPKSNSTRQKGSKNPSSGHSNPNNSQSSIPSNNNLPVTAATRNPDLRPLNSRHGSATSMSLNTTSSSDNNNINTTTTNQSYPDLKQSIQSIQPTQTTQTIPTPHKPYLSEEFPGNTPKYVTGWTPLISKYHNELLITYSSPNNKILFQLLSAANNNNNININNSNNNIINLSNSGSSSSTNMMQGYPIITGHGGSSGIGIGSTTGHETDYAQGLSLTPFITHNLQASITASGGGLGQFTPFHDKSLNLTDFFIDSPLRQSPLCELETITPSKFRLQSERKQSVKQLILENAKNGKRSINQVDTPPRALQKVNVIEKSLKDAGNELETEDEDQDEDQDENENRNENELERNNGNGVNGRRQQKHNDEDLEDLKLSVKNLLTPSKTSGKSASGSSKNGLTDISNTFETKTPLKSKNPVSNSKNYETPAPIPQSSPSTVIMSLAARLSEPSGMELSNYPHSPTPSKDVSLSMNSKVIDSGNGQVPALGLFSDQLNRRKKPVNNRAKNKAQMQAGMNKFQIVFTDVHTLMNNKSKKKTNVGDNGNIGKYQNNSGSSNIINDGNLLNSDYISLATVDMNPEVIAGLQEANKNINMSTHVPGGMMRSNGITSNPSLKRDKSYDHKDVSMNSGNNSSMNTSHLNMSTDHTSFEISGLLSTPNSKYVLDRMFEKTSPEQKNPMAYWNQPNYAMPPPQAKQHIQAQQPQQLHPSQQLAPHPMMMMMSTPQHQNVIHYGVYNDMLPSEFHSDGNLNAFGYPMPSSYAKEIKDKK